MMPTASFQPFSGCSQSKTHPSPHHSRSGVNAVISHWLLFSTLLPSSRVDLVSILCRWQCFPTLFLLPGVCPLEHHLSFPSSNPTHPQAPLKRRLVTKVFIAWKFDLPPLTPHLGLTLLGLPYNTGICEQTFFLWGRKRCFEADHG